MEVFVYIQGVQVRMDHWDLREILSWIALLLANNARWDWPRFCDSFGILALGPFRVGQCGCGCGGWLLQARWRVRLDRNGLYDG